MKLFILVERGCVQGVYSDNPKVEVEVIDLDEQDAEQKEMAEMWADKVQAQYASVY